MISFNCFHFWMRLKLRYPFCLSFFFILISSLSKIMLFLCFMIFYILKILMLKHGMYCCHVGTKLNGCVPGLYCWSSKGKLRWSGTRPRGMEKAVQKLSQGETVIAARTRHIGNWFMILMGIPTFVYKHVTQNVKQR